MTTSDTGGMETTQISPSEIIAQTVTTFMGETDTQAVAVSLYQNGEDSFFPFGDIGNGQPPTLDTIFGIGSVTKVFTATLLAGQVLAGVKRLDDAVTDYLPHGVAYEFLGRVTLQNLATHTSCMPDEAPSWVPDPSGNLFDDLPPSPELIQWWTTWQPGRCQIGQHYSYSSIGFVTLAYAVTGPLGPTDTVQGYNVDLQSAITVPLNMPSTITHIPPGAPVAQGYIGPGHKLAQGQAADLKSSSRDMLTWLKANLGALDGSIPVQLRDAIQLTHQVYFSSPELDMGLAWQIQDKDPQQPTIFSKNGATSEGGYSCWIGFIPSQQIGLSVLTNKFYGQKSPYPTTKMAEDIIHALSAQAVKQPA